jgi:HEPN domain-containing protein
MLKKETENWIRLADNDFSMMELSWDNHKYTYSVMFAQQSVEKIIKAYIVENTNSPPRKTHHIEKLITDASLDLYEIDNPDVTELSKAYGRVRYPDLSDKYYEARIKVEPLILMARKIILWIKGKLINS